MLEIKLHEVIDAESQAWIYEWFGMNHPFTLETLLQLLNDNPDEHDIKLQIHCDGGNVLEGLAIYDCLRTSGRNIYCNVEGSCHSMAIVLLLAAPKNQRTANPNAQFIIHEVQGGVSGSTTAVERYAEEMRDLQERILDIFADRTGADRAELSAAMQEEKMRDSKYMLEHGFIGAINEYNTNQIGNKMNLLDELKNLFARAEKEGVQNAAPSEELDALRNQLDTLTAERDQLQNRVTELENAQTEFDNTRTDLQGQVDSLTAERDTLTEQVNNLSAERDQLQNAVSERDNAIAERDAEIVNLKGQIHSNGTAPARQQMPNGGEQQSAEEQKQAVRDALNAQKKK